MKIKESAKRNLKYFFLTNTWSFVIGYACYWIIRRNLPGLNLIWSTVVMIMIHLIVSVILTAIEWNRNKDSYDSTINAILALGIYCVITFFEYKGRLIIILLCIATAVIAARIAYLILRYGKDQDKKLMKHKAITDIKVVLSAALAVIMLFCGYTRLFGPALMYSSPASTVDSDQSYKEALYSNIHNIRKLQKDKWETLNANERLDVLQLICDLERKKLGITNFSIKVGVGDTTPDMSGYYVHEQNTIVISSNSLMNDEPSDVCNTVCHETYHCYQRQLAELYTKTESKYQSLMIFNHVSQYAYEINNYNDGKKDFMGYYLQEFESDARDFGRQEEYFYKWIAEKGIVPRSSA